MTATVVDQLLRKLESLDQMPSLPVVVSQLLSYLEKPPDQLRISEVSNLIARDNSLAARCLHLPTRHFSGGTRQWTRSTPPSLRWAFAA